MNIIKAAGVVYKYTLRDEENKLLETHTALEELDLEIEKGSFVCILGHNGSGKSSFARLINALNVPDEGTVIVSGMNTSDPGEHLKIRGKAGMVFQNPDNQIVANVVEEDIAFGPENLGVPSDEILRRVREVTERLGLGMFRLKSPSRLSGGQKQRVAIAGIMAMKPECIVLDEPTAMLDPSGRKYVLEAVHELNRREGITIILITHNMEEAVDADRIIVFDRGKIAVDSCDRPLDGTPREIFSRPGELKAHSLKVPVITELADELRKAGLDIPGGILTRQELEECLTALYSAKACGDEKPAESE